MYLKIVAPMEKQIRSLMFVFRQHTESALFASDLRFEISGKNTEDIQSNILKSGGPLCESDEALSILNMKLKVLVSKFKAKLQALI